MTKGKVIIVTVLMATMLAAIDLGLLKLNTTGFAILTGLLAGFGFWKLIQSFAAWIAAAEKEKPLELPIETDAWLSEDFKPTYESIMAEFEAENEKAN